MIALIPIITSNGISDMMRSSLVTAQVVYATRIITRSTYMMSTGQQGCLTFRLQNSGCANRNRISTEEHVRDSEFRNVNLRYQPRYLDRRIGSPARCGTTMLLSISLLRGAGANDEGAMALRQAAGEAAGVEDKSSFHKPLRGLGTPFAGRAWREA